MGPLSSAQPSSQQTCQSWVRLVKLGPPALEPHTRPASGCLFCASPWCAPQCRSPELSANNQMRCSFTEAVRTCQAVNPMAFCGDGPCRVQFQKGREPFADQRVPVLWRSVAHRLKQVNCRAGEMQARLTPYMTQAA